MKALDEVRCEVWREAYNEAVQLTKGHPRKKGRPKADNAESAMVKTAKTTAKEIKTPRMHLVKPLSI